MTGDLERAQNAFDAADAAHEAERMLRSVAESLKRTEEADQLMFHSIRLTLYRMLSLAGRALGDESMQDEAMRRMFRRVE